MELLEEKWSVREKSIMRKTTSNTRYRETPVLKGWMSGGGAAQRKNDQSNQEDLQMEEKGLQRWVYGGDAQYVE